MTDIFDMLELNKSPMLTVENYKITAANTAARRLLGDDIVGQSPVTRIPDHLFCHRAEKFTCSAVVRDQCFSADVHRGDGIVYITLNPLSRPTSPAGYISDFLMNALLNELFTIGICINNTLQEAERSGNEKITKNLLVINRNYFSMRRGLQNLHTAIQLSKNCLYVRRRCEDLCGLCSELASTLEHLETGTGVKLNFSTVHDAVLCTIDRGQIERVILNVLCNSFAAMPNGGTINMRLEARGHEAVITVDDEGGGIDPTTMASIFSRYELPLTLENLRQPSSGGLGLFISKGILELHNGAIILENREGGGTRVSIILPTHVDKIRLECDSYKIRGGMDSVLTEFAPVLDRDYYTRKYLD